MALLRKLFSSKSSQSYRIIPKQDDKRADQDLDVHVLPVWNQGITGKGVVVTILDDGEPF